MTSQTNYSTSQPMKISEWKFWWCKPWTWRTVAFSASRTLWLKVSVIAWLARVTLLTWRRSWFRRLSIERNPFPAKNQTLKIVQTDANFHFRGPRLFSIGGPSGRFATTYVIQISMTSVRAVARGGPVVPAPPFEIRAPHFMFGPPVASYIQYHILKMWPPYWFLASPSGFWPPLLLNPGDGPDFSTRARYIHWTSCSTS